MSANYLVELAAQWYEYQGYFVRRNVSVPGSGRSGGVELDVLATDPERGETIHVEASMDSDSWQKREQRFRRKFRAGRAYVESLADGAADGPVLKQFALLVYAGKTRRRVLGGGELLLMPRFLHQVIEVLSAQRMDRHMVPEHLPLLRTLQFVSEYRDDLFARDWLF